MSELAEVFKEMKAASKLARDAESQRNHKRIWDILERSELDFRRHNNGHHLVLITVDGREFDYWPSRQKWHDKQSDKWETGLTKLLKIMKVKI